MRRGAQAKKLGRCPGMGVAARVGVALGGVAVAGRRVGDEVAGRRPAGAAAAAAGVVMVVLGRKWN